MVTKIKDLEEQLTFCNLLLKSLNDEIMNPRDEHNIKGEKISPQALDYG